MVYYRKKTKGLMMQLGTFRMAYVILCHKNIEQINLLIKQLDDMCVDFFVHIDKKSNIESDLLKADNVYLVDDRVSVNWGHYSIVESVLKCFSYVNRRGKYNYVHVISGQDFPLVPNYSIIDFFKKNEGLEFIRHTKMELDSENYKRVSVYYPEFLIHNSRHISIMRSLYVKTAMILPFLRRDLKNLPQTLYKGSNWFTITGGCMEYILEFTEKNPKYVQFFHNSLCADEIFFQTLILNSHFKSHVINDYKRYVDWSEGLSNPKVFTTKDSERLQQEGDECFWARKFDINIDRNILENLILKISKTEETQRQKETI